MFNEECKYGLVSSNDNRILSILTRANRILGAYSDDRPFSIDLVGAVSHTSTPFARAI